MVIVCVMCGAQTKEKFNTTVICWKCYPEYEERRAMNELQSAVDDWDKYIKEKI